MNTRCPPKRVPSAARFFTHCKLTVQPPQSYSVGGQRSAGQLTGKPAGARPDYRGRCFKNNTLNLFCYFEESCRDAIPSVNTHRGQGRGGEGELNHMQIEEVRPEGSSEALRLMQKITANSKFNKNFPLLKPFTQKRCTGVTIDSCQTIRCIDSALLHRT
ncbi:UNVERIFIED_CONTAM: hypothetical protein FKN15_051895 [Acipenser sinensis]